MGFDLDGMNPINKEGEYFRNNCWWWRPLWTFTCHICSDILTSKDMEKGGFNDGKLIGKDKAIRISIRLKEAIDNKEKYYEFLKKMDEGFIEMQKRIALNISGKISRADTKSSYPFDWENVKEFAEFCENSGGFRIY